MRKLPIPTFICCLWLWFASIGIAMAEEDLLEPDAAFELSYAVKNAETLAFSWAISDGYYLYQHQFQFASKTAGIELGVPELPKGESKQDKFFGTVEIYHERVNVELPIRRLDAKVNQVVIDLSYQGCAEAKVCYLPIQKTVTFDLPEIDKAGAGIIMPPFEQSMGLSEPDRIARLLSGHSLDLILLSFLGFGLLLAFTPCVFPMIPIISGIVIGDGTEISTRRAFALSLCYVLASALTYTVFGILAALFGQNLQAVFQQSWILVVTSALFVLLSLSMFGVFSLQIPAFIQTRIASYGSQQRPGNWLGAVIMGALSALTIGPCVTPPLAGALIYIGQSGDALLGGMALFALGLGMGVPLLLVGTSAGKLLPRAGAWLHVTRIMFGVGLLAVAVWLLGRILPTEAMLPLWGLILSVPLLYLGWKKLWKIAGFIASAYTILLMFGIATENQRKFLETLCNAAIACQAEPLTYRKVNAAEDLQRYLAEAQQKNQWLMLDFHADWCVSCLEMQNTTFADPRVRAALSALTLVQADVTEEEAAARSMLRRYDLIGPPAILFFGPDQRERKLFRIVGYMDSDTFLAHVHKLIDHPVGPGLQGETG